MIKLKEHILPSILSLLMIISLLLSENLQYTKLFMDIVSYGLIVLAILIPIKAGMGFNFAIILGAIAGHIGLITAVNFGLTGFLGILIAMIIAIPIALLFGYLVGLTLSPHKGQDMIISLFLGYLGDYTFQFIGLFILGTFIPLSEHLLMPGGGIANVLDLSALKPKLFIVVTIILTSLLILFIKYAQDHKLSFLVLRGEKTDQKSRLNAIIISTIIAGIGQIIYLQNYGFMVTYASYKGISLFAATAIAFGGGSFKKASIIQAIWGLILLKTFNMVFIPLISQTSGNLSGVIRSLTTTGILLVSFIMAYKGKKSSMPLEEKKVL